MPILFSYLRKSYLTSVILMSAPKYSQTSFKIHSMPLTIMTQIGMTATRKDQKLQNYENGHICEQPKKPRKRT